MGRLDLGLAEAEFWALHAWQFFALLERRNRQQRQHDAYVDAIVRALRDPYRPPGSPPFEPGTFFGGAALRPARPQTVDEAKAAVSAALAAAKRKG